MSRFDPTSWQVLSPLLDELLDLDAPARARRLAELETTNPALAGQAAELLARQPAIRVEQFLEDSVSAPLAVDALAGRVVGGYTIERAIGHGGMGTVWLARRSDGRYEGAAAIKFLNLALLGRGGAERFRREGSALAKLAHPNITHLIDAGMCEGQPYLMLEYVEGERIDRWCDSREIDVAARVRLFLQVLAAVSHAHGRLILHRDLKPSNILVTADGRVKLLDFGLAKLLESEESGELTRLGGHAFTPDYAAPEQMEQAAATAATDIYALGVLLYVLIAGSHPTADATATPAERMRALVEREARRASDAARGIDAAAARARRCSPTQLARILRGDLDNIVAHALQKAPDERYASVDAFAADLQRYLDHEPISVRRFARLYRLGKFVRRYRFTVATTSVTILVLLGALAGITWQAHIARRERDEALYQREIAAARGNLMELVVQAATDAGQPITQRDVLDRSVRLIEKQFGKDPRVAIDLMYPVAAQYAALGESDKDVAVMQRAAELAAASGDPQLIGHVACNTVHAELTRGRLDAARTELQQGLSAMALVSSPTLTSVLECTRAEAEVAIAEGNFERAIERITNAIDRLEGLGRTKGGQYGTLLGVLAALHERRGDLPAAFGVFDRLRRWHESLGRTDTTNYLAALGAMARVHLTWGEYVEARKIIDAIAPRVQDAAGEAAAPVWFVYVQGSLRWRFGDLEGARELLQTNADRLRQRGAIDQVWRIETALVRVLSDMQRFGEAERLLLEVEKNPPQRAETPALLAGLRAQLLLGQSRPIEAAAAIDAALTRMGYPAVTHTSALGSVLRTAALAHLASGDTARALQMGQAAVAVSEKVARDPERSADVGESLLILSQVQRTAGQQEQSVASAKRAYRALGQALGSGHRLTRDALQLAGVAGG
jgi:eukaryotic-like serine/threonine-protein kinase